PKQTNKLKPQKLWDLFFEICAIPHASGNEAALSDFIFKKAKAAGLKAYQDKLHNLLVEKPASSGYKNAKTVILQSHLDMVAQKNSDIEFNFETDAIKTIIEDEWVRADGTTLGADNGIGVAAAMMVMLDDKLTHGPLRILFTVQEETGLVGIKKLSKKFAEGYILLNLDSMDKDEICVGCAGGARLSSDFMIQWDKLCPDVKAYKIEVSGLPGGHSGADIDKNRGNAIKLLIDLLKNVSEVIDLKISVLDGGMVDNVISNSAFAIVTVPEDESEILIEATRMFSSSARAEHDYKHPIMEVAESWCMPTKVWSNKFTDKILQVLSECPHGVIATSKGMPGIVKTSTNLAVLKTSMNKLKVKTSQRSFCEDDREEITNKISDLFDGAGALSYVDNEYPAWAPSKNSKIVSLICNVYREAGKKISKKAVHAGIECALIGSLNPKLDMVSFGPTIENLHSTKERVNIASVDNFYNCLVKILERVAKNI
ncbi:MAG: beta-Ala-His dipeptidase, partial [Victivallales bacterium]|nr:beta-Ala-His dipeptidase [Victivallales bacterium]